MYQYRIDYHGSSGLWRELNRAETLETAMGRCSEIKRDGYGARVVDTVSGLVVVNAEWQRMVEVCDVFLLPTEYASGSRALKGV